MAVAALVAFLFFLLRNFFAFLIFLASLELSRLEFFSALAIVVLSASLFFLYTLLDALVDSRVLLMSSESFLTFLRSYATVSSFFLVVFLSRSVEAKVSRWLSETIVVADVWAISAIAAVANVLNILIN